MEQTGLEVTPAIAAPSSPTPLQPPSDDTSQTLQQVYMNISSVKLAVHRYGVTKTLQYGTFMYSKHILGSIRPYIYSRSPLPTRGPPDSEEHAPQLQTDAPARSSISYSIVLFLKDY